MHKVCKISHWLFHHNIILNVTYRRNQTNPRDRAWGCSVQNAAEGMEEWRCIRQCKLTNIINLYDTKTCRLSLKIIQVIWLHWVERFYTKTTAHYQEWSRGFGFTPGGRGGGLTCHPNGSTLGNGCSLCDSYESCSVVQEAKNSGLSWSKMTQTAESWTAKLRFGRRLTRMGNNNLITRLFDTSRMFSDEMDQILVLKQVILQRLRGYKNLSQLLLHFKLTRIFFLASPVTWHNYSLATL